jgi:hypothetical protein
VSGGNQKGTATGGLIIEIDVVGEEEKFVYLFAVAHPNIEFPMET